MSDSGVVYVVAGDDGEVYSVWASELDAARESIRVMRAHPESPCRVVPRRVGVEADVAGAPPARQKLYAVVRAAGLEEWEGAVPVSVWSTREKAEAEIARIERKDSDRAWEARALHRPLDDLPPYEHRPSGLQVREWTLDDPSGAEGWQ